MDPDWNAGESGYTYVDSHWPSVSYWNGGGGSDGSVHVGYLPAEWDYTYGVSHVTRGFYQFSTSALAGKKIIKAVMNTTEVWSPSCTGRAVSAYATSTVGSGTTWGAQPTWGTKFSTVTVAKGNSASCPAGTVGFDMGTAMSALSTDALWSVGLRADNESDSLGWKRFDNDATMVVTYDSYPSTPALWWIDNALYSPAKGQPGAVYYTRLSTPTFHIMSMGDPDGDAGGNLTMYVSVKNSAGTVVDSGTEGPGSPDYQTLFTWQGTKVLPDGTYTVNSYVKDSQGAASGTQSFAFTIDTTPPKAPKITPVSPGITAVTSTSGSTSAIPGQDAVQLTLSDGGTLGVDKFIYAVTNDGQVTAQPASMACGTANGPYIAVCASSNTATITLSPIDESTTISAWSVDAAGNVNEVKQSTTATTYTLSTGGEAPLPHTLLPVNVSGGAAWTDQTVCAMGSPDVASCTDPTNQRPGKVLNLSVPGAHGDVLTGAVDTSKAFTTAAWVKPQGGTGTQSIMTQVASSGGPGSRLGILADSNGAPQFALQGWTSSTAEKHVLNNASTGVQDGAWVYVVSAYDPLNKQLRITVSNKAQVTTWVTATSGVPFLASSATQPVRFGYLSASSADQFLGSIYRPIMAQGVLTSTQINNLKVSFDDNGEQGLMK